MLGSKPLPPIHPASSTKSSVSFQDLGHKALVLYNTRNPSTSHPGTDEHGAPQALETPRGPTNRPGRVFHRQMSSLVKLTTRPEDGIAAMSAALSTRCPVVRDTGTNDFKRSRTIYTTNATLVDRRGPNDSKTEIMDTHHKRHSNRRRKDAALSMNSNLSFPPGKVIKRNDDNIIIPQMFPKVRRVDRGGPCPTQLYAQTRFSYSDKINRSVQLDHYVRRNSRPRIEPLRVPSTFTGTSAGGGDSLDSVISSSKMTLEGRTTNIRTDREWPVRGLSPLFKQCSYFDEELSVPPNSEIGLSRMQILTPYEH